MKSHLRLIGDVHGHKDNYRKLCRKALYTIQLGDHAFDYLHLNGLDPNYHQILGGNHDNYDLITAWPHYLGDYGLHQIPGFGDVFFVRGAFSIDRHLRTEGVNWWQDEEMSIRQGYRAIDLYKSIRPSFVISHTCPTDAISFVTKSGHLIPSRTSQLLNQMFAIHQPPIWVFAHFHTSLRFQINGTEFVCLNELECLDFDRRI